MAIKIALAGNPNSGKTTMFNDLTGSSQRVGNWPGVTVEKKEGKFTANKDVLIQDLPGIYSLSPYTPEEVISRDYLINNRPDAIINIVDASNLERSLYLTTQLAELGVPVALALNMSDVVKKNGDEININRLSDMLGCVVVETSAVKGVGSREVTEAAIALANKNQVMQPKHHFSSDVEAALEDIAGLISGKVNEANKRWYATKLFERDRKVFEELGLDKAMTEQLEGIISKIETDHDDDSESIITVERYNFINKVIDSSVKYKSRGKLSLSDRIDQIVTNRALALPIFAAVMTLIYYISISTVGTAMTDWANETLFGEMIPETVRSFLVAVGTADWLNSLILDGIVAGVGAVLGFLPQMLTLFLCLAIIEECGYMARVAFIMDRIFRKFGLSGKSFIPMLVTTGCGVPGIMASRTIENESDRRMTVMTTTFIPCGAKLPIIALIAGAIFPEAIWLAPSTYFLGIVAIIISGIMLKKTKMFSGEPSPFVMELPAYHLPSLRGVIRTSLQRCWAFVKKATTIVMLATVLVWFMSSYNFSMEAVEANDSMLAAVGNAIAPIFTPLGWGDWKAAVATVTGLLAKENVVGTFGVLYGFGEVAEDGAEYWGQLSASFTAVAAYSFLAFNLLCAPCVAAIGALRREMMSGKWTVFAITYQCVFAYAVALVIYQIGSLFTGGGFGVGTVAALGVIGIITYFLIRKPYEQRGMPLGEPLPATR